jgi:hypothetical protein
MRGHIPHLSDHIHCIRNTQTNTPREHRLDQYSMRGSNQTQSPFVQRDLGEMFVVPSSTVVTSAEEG